MPDSVIEECCQAWNAGWVDGQGTKWFWGSIEAAVAEVDGCDFLRGVVEDYGVKNVRATLWQRMLAASPTMRLRRRPFKWPFTDAQRLVRIHYCSEKLAMADLLQRLKAVVWIDAKKLYTRSNRDFVYCDAASAELPDFMVPETRFPKHKLHFYIAVNAMLGPVKAWFVTGTSGIKKTRAKVYTVRSARLYLALYITQLLWGYARAFWRAILSSEVKWGMSMQCMRKTRWPVCSARVSKVLSSAACCCRVVSCMFFFKCCSPSI